MESNLSTKEERTKNQNLVSVSIVLAGLLVGSLFIDLAQLVSGSGFSKKVVSENNIIRAGGKTWVAFSDPEVSIRVLTDSECKRCAPDQSLLWIRRIMPTVSAEIIEYDSYEGQRLSLDYQLTSIPAFLFSKKVSETAFFEQAPGLFTEVSDSYVFDMKKIGQNGGRFLKLPEIDSEDIVLGSNDATKLTVIEYSDFECPYCKLFHSSIKEMLKEYSGDIRYVYKHLPLSFHPQAENASLASECANEQGKFSIYSDMLFSKQEEWQKTTGTGKMKEYARNLRLDTRQFNLCLDSKKYLEKVASDKNEAGEFGISGTPGVFIGEQFIGGALPYSELKQIIEKELSR